MGGAESLVMPFARGIDRNGYELFVCCLTTIGGNVNAPELDVVNLGARNLRDVAAFRRLLRFIRDHDIDLIHAHLAYAATWAALASRITGVPSVATLHVAPPASGRARFRDRLMRFVLRRWSSQVIAVSDALRRQYGDERFLVAHNGIDVDLFGGSRQESRELITRELGIPLGAKIVATVSVLREGKGVEVLLRAFERIDDAYLLIIGDGPKREEWQALAKNDRIRWAGFRRDVHALLPACDLFVLASFDDAFPTVLLEAMAAGLPIVASRVGGIPEITDEVLVPPGDAEALGAAIRELLADDGRRRAMSESARARARERFSTAAWIARLEEIYSRVLQAPRGADRS
ncbi:MAG TPA: glycosyltransferase family 4 protein [Thermoanaerobaculia bacterium]|jgi:glycosyltransferase involved in cell wall biosynthesis